MSFKIEVYKNDKGAEMILKGDISAVDAAIFKTKGMFNKQAVAAAQRKFTDFANCAEEKLTHFENLASNQAAQITRLSEEAAEAVKKLRAADVEIAYVKADLEKANTVIESQEKRLAKTKERIKKPDITLDNGNILKRELKKSTGTELQTEITPQGRKVGYKVISADETAQRSGTFDPNTQQRISTTTGKGDTIVYDIAGKTKSITEAKPNLPELLSSNVEVKNNRRILTEDYSDGTRIVSQKAGNWGKIEKTKSDGKRIETLEEYIDNGYRHLYHFKFDDRDVAKTLELTKTPLNSNRSAQKYIKHYANDIEGNRYTQEGSLETDFVKLKGKVSKIDKFGDLEEFSFKADCNPQYKINDTKYKSIEGTCRIKKEYGRYKLVPKEITYVTTDGKKYTALYNSSGYLDNYKSSSNIKTSQDVKDFETARSNLYLFELFPN